MTSSVVTVRADASIDEVVAVMEDDQIRRVPVVDEGGCCAESSLRRTLPPTSRRIPRPHVVGLADTGRLALRNRTGAGFVRAASGRGGDRRREGVGIHRSGMWC